MKEWAQFVHEQEQEFGKDTVEKWLKPLKIVRFDACNLYLQAQDSFQSLWFEEHVRKKLDGFVNGTKKKIVVHLEALGEKAKAKQKKPKTQDATFHIQFTDLDPSSTFDTFLVHDENLVAYRILEEAAISLCSHKLKALSSFSEQTPEALKKQINPILLYGPTGSGKTHLLQALCQRLKHVGYNVLYTSAETFTDHVVKAIRASNMAPFRQIYRALDALVFDDVQNLAKKNATQEEFFHTFNALHTDHKLIVLASNCAPNMLQNIEPRLISRFEWGISLPMSVLSKKELVKMIEKKAGFLNYPLSAVTAEFLAETFYSNSKSCVRALEALVLRSHIDAKQAHQKRVFSRGVNQESKKNLTLSQVKECLHDLIEKEKKQQLTCEDITKHVALHFGMLCHDLTGKSQSREFVVARQLAMLLCRELLKIPYMKIGDFFHRDHSTVLSGIKQVQKQISEKNNDMLSIYNRMKLELG